MNENFTAFLEDLEAEYPKHDSLNTISSNYGRPMRIELKDGNIFGVVWFRWEHQTQADVDKKILCFNTGNRDIDKFKLDFARIKKVNWG